DRESRGGAIPRAHARRVSPNPPSPRARHRAQPTASAPTNARTDKQAPCHARPPVSRNVAGSREEDPRRRALARNRVSARRSSAQDRFCEAHLATLRLGDAPVGEASLGRRSASRRLLRNSADPSGIAADCSAIPPIPPGFGLARLG